jgi:hypothetical protein
MTTSLTFSDALRIARGCTDYGGGYREVHDMEIYQHGIKTVIAALTVAEQSGLSDSQTAVLYRIGTEAAYRDAPAPARLCQGRV